MDITIGLKFTLFCVYLHRLSVAVNLLIMTLKIFRAVWFLSMLAVLANLMYVYAGLPEEINLATGTDAFVIGKESFFYVALVMIAIANLLVYLFSKKLMPQEDFRIWLHGFVVTLNIFFIIGLSFIGLYNSLERFDFSRIGFIIYSSVGLVVLWVVGWPLYLIGKKFGAKQAV